VTPVVSLRGVGKSYRVYPTRRHRLKELMSFGKREHGKDFWALQDVSFDIEPGTTLGILGRNGAGKSTLLKVISGVLQPTTGTVEVNGRLAALFGVGAGFNPEFTGRDNAMLNGLLLGIDHREMLERFDEIEAFADIGDFMDQPVKTYSSGMRARLGFAVAVNVEPDILVLDETLSVGDAVFKQMGLQKMRDLRDSGTTILFVSHSLGMVRSFCSEAILIHKGQLIHSGPTGETLDRYQALLSSIKAKKGAQLSEEDRQLDYMIEHEDEEDAGEATPSFKEGVGLAGKMFRHGTGEARVHAVEVLDELHRPNDRIPLDSTMTVRVHASYERAVEASEMRIILRNKAGLDVFSTATGSALRPSLGGRAAGERVVVDFAFRVPLRPGDYSITAALSRPEDRDVYLDRVDVAAVFKIERPDGRGSVQGLIDLPAQVRIHDQENSSRSA
jgi:ABC-2 type transport system ATP-binding protein